MSEPPSLGALLRQLASAIWFNMQLPFKMRTLRRWERRAGHAQWMLDHAQDPELKTLAREELQRCVEWAERERRRLPRDP